MGIADGRASSSSPESLFAPATADGRPVAPVLGATITPWVLDLIRRYRAAAPSMRVCAHLAEDPDEGAVWQSSIFDLRTCRRAECTGAALAVLEERLGHPPEDEPARCTTCGRTGVAVRGVGVAVGPTMLRGTVCDHCLAAQPIPTPSSATDPVAGVDAPSAQRQIEPDDEPLDVDVPELAAAESRIPFDAVGRRALRRGWLMAEACARTTAPGLAPDRAVIGGLLVRAAKLAKGLAGPAPTDGAFVHDLAFRSLVETTTTLWWLLRAEAADAATATAAFRDAGPAGPGSGQVRDRLADLGREADHTTLLSPSPDAVPGSWRELTTLHLSERPDGFALDLGNPEIGPIQALIAGEHLSLACADYVDRMPTDLDPDQLRRLADELTELRANVEVAYAEAFPESGDA
ncbi:hypothetical protein AB0L40_04220 [Patulibacter sp. NPDC049589]|uniref:hypothetical protein n=1 Tax=Patulibacter sp. NPDC049589 TaxID=3154731 RepID=UPI003442A20E